MTKTFLCDKCRRQFKAEFEVSNVETDDGGYRLCEKCLSEWERAMTEAFRQWFAIQA